ncbi:hypothetical protein, partial [Intestinimonas butyriciproducens]|uniref:hypothetical protein n=1 Tax=Intestinimonas butyriciproducens TaxID=1297617 RepID=UPI0019592B9B
MNKFFRVLSSVLACAILMSVFPISMALAVDTHTKTYSHAGITITATTSQEEALPDPDSVTAKPHGTQITSG